MDSTRHDSISTLIERQQLQIEMQRIIYQQHFPAIIDFLLSQQVLADLNQSVGAILYQSFYHSNVQEYVGRLCERVMTIFRTYLIQQINALEREYENKRDRLIDNFCDEFIKDKAQQLEIKMNNQSENRSKRRMKHMKSAELKRDWRKQEPKGRSKPKKFKK